MNTLTMIWSVFNYGLVLLYGLFLSVAIAGGWDNRRHRLLVLASCPLFLLIQILCWLLFGVDAARELYPLIVHLPLALVLIFALKKPVGIALISICTAYLCCQVPHFGSIVAIAITDSPLAGEIVYTVLIVPIYFLLYRFFAPAAYNAMIASPQALLLFGSLPAFYYIFDYATRIYTSLLYEGNRALVEAIPSVLILFYVAVLTAYHQQLKQHNQTELENSLLSTQLKQAEGDMAALRRSESQTTLYRHDMRHHLSVISGFLDDGKPEQAREYIKGVQANIETITPKRFCQNEMINLLCSSFTSRAQNIGVRLTVKADLPEALNISDIGLCALLSNGLENALTAAGRMEEKRRWVNCFINVRMGKLLIEVKNPYAGAVVMQGDLPISEKEGHGYGCRSIQAIAQSCHGLCQFETIDGIFLLRVILPLH